MPKTDKYIPFHDGDGFKVGTDNGIMYIACCDCGLVHRMEIHRSSRWVYMRMYRDKRRTSANRRAKNIKVEHHDELVH
jgi:hypothetical protein